MSELIALNEIQKQNSLCETSSFREARTLARRTAFWAYDWEQSGEALEPNQIDILTRALELGESHHSWPGKWANARVRLICQKRHILGLPEPITIAEIKRKISVEMGCIVFIDAQSELPQSFYEAGSENYNKSKTAGEFHDISLHGDGLINMRMRYVDCSEPLITRAEMRRLRGATPCAWVHSPNQSITVWGGAKNITLPIKSKSVLISCFLLGRGRSKEVIAIMCDAKGERPILKPASLEDGLL